MITVFYDGKCSVCSKEIAYYKRIAAPGLFDWQDVTEDASVLLPHGISLAEALKSLHVMDESGRLEIGVDAFIVIWKQLPYWKILGFFVSLPLIRHMAKWAYRLFAAWRFKRLTHCQIALKEEISSSYANVSPSPRRKS